MNVTETLDRYGFAEAGDIVLSDSGIPGFRLTADWQRSGLRGQHQGLVYLWVDVTNSDYKIKYVGKAGKTLQKRLSEHVGGFRGGSKTGVQNAHRICECLDQDRTLKVYARPSPVIVINDEMLNSYSIDEESFIVKFRKQGHELWNT